MHTTPINHSYSEALETAKRKLEALSPDKEIEYCRLHPSTLERTTRSVLSTTGMLGLLIATGSTGFGGALILLASVFGYGAYENSRITEVTYHCHVPITRTEIKKINTIENILIPNENYVVVQDPNSQAIIENGKCTVRFTPATRRRESAGDSFSYSLTNEVFVIYTTHEHHPKFYEEIKKCRAEIKRLEENVFKEQFQEESVHFTKMTL